MKAKKIIIAVLAVLLVLAPFIPYRSGTYEDGGTREYRALAYTVVFWHKIFDDGNGPVFYEDTSVFWYPDNKMTIDEMWQSKTEK